jgi:hypothetical protein
MDTDGEAVDTSVGFASSRWPHYGGRNLKVGYKRIGRQ